jgi:Na+/melibiose symporter-like transporter
MATLIVWAALYLAARFLLELPNLSWWTRATIAVVPVPAFMWVLWSMFKGVSKMDELQRRIQLEALAFAFPLTLLLVMTLGLLEIAVGLNKDDWSYRHVWQILVILYLGGLFRAKRRYE